jgi:hypothetical protein
MLGVYTEWMTTNIAFRDRNIETEQCRATREYTVWEEQKR